ncbi:MAG: chorismate synthase, partial [Flavobacteriales bacterium]|nr:chorismate synthase [Flavobacteriales bacterium]
MPGNTFGQLFRLTTFGESHGAAIGGVIDGCPSGLKLDLEAVQQELDRRRPGSTPLGTARKESDRVEWLSGILDGTTLGTPIAFLLRNTDARSGDYDHLKDVYRPGHADMTWEEKYGIRDHRGGGRASARETACRVVGGAIARQLLARQGIAVQAYVSRVGGVALEQPPERLRFQDLWNDPVRCPDPATSARMAALIEQVRSEGDSIGGVVSGIATGMPVGLGEPVFDKLDGELARAMLSINAVKGFQLGNGFRAATLRGSENNDAFVPGYRQVHHTGLPEGARIERPAVRTETNRSGGTLGGLSSGEDLLFDVAFKPPSTIARPQRTVDQNWQAVTLEASGRHDPCVVPRAVP